MIMLEPNFIFFLSDCKDKLKEFVKNGYKNKIIPLPVSYLFFFYKYFNFLHQFLYWSCCLHSFSLYRVMLISFVEVHRARASVVLTVLGRRIHHLMTQKTSKSKYIWISFNFLNQDTHWWRTLWIFWSSQLLSLDAMQWAALSRWIIRLELGWWLLDHMVFLSSECVCFCGELILWT